MCCPGAACDEATTFIPIWKWGRERAIMMFLFPVTSLKFTFLCSTSSRGIEWILPWGEDATSHRHDQGREIQSCTLLQNIVTGLQAGRWELEKIGGHSNLFCSLSMDSADNREKHSCLFLVGLLIQQCQEWDCFGTVEPQQHKKYWVFVNLA